MEIRGNQLGGRFRPSGMGVGKGSILGVQTPLEIKDEIILK